MAVPIKLRIILGENNSQRLILQDGIPDTVCELEESIKSQCGVETPFQTDAIDVKRECILKALCVFLNEEPENLLKEYTDAENSEAAMVETTFGIYVIRKEGVEPVDEPDVGTLQN